MGLLIYWTWSNVLTILQQYVIMRRFKVGTTRSTVCKRGEGKGAPARRPDGGGVTDAERDRGPPGSLFARPASS